MRLTQRLSAHIGRGLFLVLGLIVLVALIGLASEGRTSPLGAAVHPPLQATIFKLEGTDLVRVQTSLLKDGKSAVNTKMDKETPAYKALMDKHSYEGDATIFGKKYHADYAPLTDESGNLTGALFVGVPK